MNTILVQMSEKCWTMEAMHLSSALARSIDGKIVLLRLVLANNPGLLGWGISSPTAQENRLIEEYAMIAEDYDVEFWVQPMQYVTQIDALVQAVEILGASVLFADIPQSRVPYWRQLRLWSLRHQLDDCRLYILDKEENYSISKPMVSPVQHLEAQANR